MDSARPTTVDQLKEMIAGVITDESIRRAMEFKPRESDIIISPYGKCGTTFLQQTVHGLRTRGDMSFREISEVVPWLETAHVLGIDLDGPQIQPRAFKSHMSWDLIPKGGRYIVSFRNPTDRSVSFYRFFEDWWFERDSISFTEFTLDFAVDFAFERSCWYHLKSWWDRRDDPNVLLLTFEDMTTDLTGTVQTVADFCAIDLDSELRRIVETQSSREFMASQRVHFDDHLMRELTEKVRGIPSGSDSYKIRAKNYGEREQLVTEDVVRALDQIWREEITEPLGFATYDEFRRAVVEHSGVLRPRAEESVSP